MSPAVERMCRPTWSKRESVFMFPKLMHATLLLLWLGPKLQTWSFFLVIYCLIRDLTSFGFWYFWSVAKMFINTGESFFGLEKFVFFLRAENILWIKMFLRSAISQNIMHYQIKVHIGRFHQNTKLFINSLLSNTRTVNRLFFIQIILRYVINKLSMNT